MAHTTRESTTIATELHVSDLDLKPEILAHKRTTWVPTVEERDGDLSASKFGGQPWLAADEDWPVCPNCELPMQHFVQLDLATLPAAEQARLGDSGMIQLFYCTSDDPLCEVDCEAYFPFADSVVARFLPDTSGPSRSDAQGPAERHPPILITGWEAKVDLPNWEELEYSLGVEMDDEEGDEYVELEVPVYGDKLGGWPAWVQGVEYPNCPECEAEMELVFQIDSEDNVPHMFGDVGTGHLTRCPNHPHVLAFAWACH